MLIFEDIVRQVSSNTTANTTLKICIVSVNIVRQWQFFTKTYLLTPNSDFVLVLTLSHTGSFHFNTTANTKLKFCVTVSVFIVRQS